MRALRRLALVAMAGAVLVQGSAALAADREEAWIPEPMPRGFRVESSPMDGPVFANAEGRTLYRWPFRVMRNGVTGDPRGESVCTGVKYTESGGFMSPYPGGLVLPELDTRPACTDVWPPELAPAGAEAAGKWSVITRKDGRQQWAYDGAALYTSVLDHAPGDVLGGDKPEQRGDSPAVREPIAPALDLPPGFSVNTTLRGRMLLTERGFTVYTSDADRGGRSSCTGACAQEWQPLAAPASGRARGDWRIVDRADGARQWAFRGRPLYRHLADTQVRSLEGTDVPGWKAVYLQELPHPREFTVQQTPAGEVLADAQGKTIYTYTCGDDAPDQLGCDHPSETQVYRIGLCGGGSAERCLKNFPYVLAAGNSRSGGPLWGVLAIDPRSGHFAQPGAPEAMRVWAFRGRPVYTFAGDPGPGDTNAESLGEFQSERTGYRAFWLRNDVARVGF